MKVMTFNLKNDTFFTKKSMRWDTRRRYVQNIIQLHAPDIIGVQELTPQTKQQMEELLPEYCFIGKPRNRLLSLMNEQTDIGFLKANFECLQQNTFWLSSHPDKKGSRVWTSVFPRICTKALLLDKRTHQKMLVYNTHLDHLIPHSRLKELIFLARSIMEEAVLDIPVILMGDFNTTLDSKALRNFMNQSKMMKSVYTSMHHPTHNTIHHGRGKLKPKSKPIDYIFVSQEVEVENCEIITTHFNGFYPSDHYPVICQLNLKEDRTR